MPNCRHETPAGVEYRLNWYRDRSAQTKTSPVTGEIRLFGWDAGLGAESPRRNGFVIEASGGPLARPATRQPLEVMATAASANPRQLLPGQPVHVAPATEGGFHLDKVVGVFDHLADDGRVLSLGVGAHGGQHAFGGFSGAEAHQLTFVGDVERVQAEDFAGGADRFAHRQAAFFDHQSDAGLAGNFVQRGGQAAAGGVAQYVDVRLGGEDGRHQAVQRRRVGLDGGLEAQPFPQRNREWRQEDIRRTRWDIAVKIIGPILGVILGWPLHVWIK